MPDLPYILVDEFGVKNTDGVLVSGILHKVKQALSLPVLNYQYGTVKELNTTLKQYTESNDWVIKKFPLVWLAQPFTIERIGTGWFGETRNLRVFIIQETDKNFKSDERMTSIFKPILYPIYIQLLIELEKSQVFDNHYGVDHAMIDRYYWGNEQQLYLNDIVDCMEVSEMKLKINNKCYQGLG